MSKNKSRIVTFFGFLFLVITCLFGVGKSDWVLDNSEPIGGITGNAAEAVCYSTNSNSNGTTYTYYTNIDCALDNIKNNGLADKLYVIPSLANDTDSNYGSGAGYTHTLVTLTRDNEIESTDSLILPIDGTIYSNLADTEYAYRGGVAYYQFADSCPDKVKENRKIVLKIANGVKLDNYGTIIVGGLIGNSGIYSAGQTNSSYCEILMEDNAVINSYNSFNLLGYVKKDQLSSNPTLNIASGNFRLPLVIYDYQGGNFVNSQHGEGIFPLRIFDFVNTQVKTSISYGATMYTYVQAYTGTTSAMNNVIVPLVGNQESYTISYKNEDNELGDRTLTTVILMSQGSQIDIEYKPYVNGTRTNIGLTDNNHNGSTSQGYLYTIPSLTEDYFCKYTPYFTTEETNQNYYAYTDITLNGNVTVRDISMTVSGTNLTTANKMFPVSYKWRIYINSGTCSFNVQIKILPGGVIYVKNGGTGVFKWNTYVATSSEYPRTCSTYTGGTRRFYPNGFADGNLTVDGILQSSSDSSHGIGGYINTNSDTGKLYINGNNSCPLLYPKAVTKELEILGHVLEGLDTATLTSNVKAAAINDFTRLETSGLPTGTYEGIQVNSSYGFGTYNGTATIAGGDTLSTDVTATYSVSDNGSYQLGDKFRWFTSDPTLISLNSTTGQSITVTSHENGTATLTCDVYYKGNYLKTASKTIEIKEPYVNVSVSVEQNYNTNDDFSTTDYYLGGIGDYRDLTVTVDTNCTNWNLSIDKTNISTFLLIDKDYINSTSASTLHLKSTASGTGTISFNFTSNEINEANIWEQEISVNNNIRLSSFSVTLTNSGTVTGTTNNADYYINASSCSTNPSNANLGTLGYANLASTSSIGNGTNYISIKNIYVDSNGTLIVYVNGRCGSLFGSKISHGIKFNITSNNGINGSTITSNEVNVKLE